MIVLKSKSGVKRTYKGSSKAGSLAELDSYFDSAALKRAKDQPEMSREKLFYMDIKDFLALAKGGFDSAKERTVELLLRDKIPLSSLPYLIVANKPDKNEDVGISQSARNWQVEGHEGRHRARAFAALGFTKVPVIIKHATLRWDRAKNRPEYVWAQAPKKDALLYEDVFKE